MRKWKLVADGLGMSASLTATDLGMVPSRVWNPSPTESHCTDPYPLPKTLRMGIRGTPESGAKYSPPPFAIVVEDNLGRALLLSIQAQPGWHRWLQAAFEVSDSGVRITLDLEGRTDPVQACERVLIHGYEARAGESRYDLLRRGLLAQYPDAGQPPGEPPGWWRRPIYCGWGDQVATAMWLEGVGPERRARAYCIQGLYQRWIDRLDAADVPFGTIIIDHGWSPNGVWEPFQDRWPDLRGFIARQHERGRKVLLWLATWLHDGLPDEWCIIDRGHRLTCDPTHPAYRDHVKSTVHRLLSPAGFDADGFKIDQLAYCPTQRHAAGDAIFGHSRGLPPEPLRLAAGTSAPWGCELLYQHQKDIYIAAKAAKPDCLVTSSTVHPYFHDTFDMTRLHDAGVVEHDPVEAMRARADLSRAALPHKPIDTDDWITRDYGRWMHYTMNSHVLGVPCIFYAERFMADWANNPATTQIPLEDLRRIGDAWRGQGY